MKVKATFILIISFLIFRFAYSYLFPEEAQRYPNELAEYFPSMPLHNLEITEQELQQKPWHTQDNGDLIAATLVDNGLNHCLYFRYKIVADVEYKGDGITPENSTQLWLQCSVDDKKWHDNFLVYPLIKAVIALKHEDEIIKYL